MENNKRSVMVEKAKWGHAINSVDETNDLASEWQEFKENGGKWGGRGRGGRGLRFNYNSEYVNVDNVDIAFPGKEILLDAKLRLYPGHRYGLLGENGIGKSTLLRCIARGIEYLFLIF